MDAALFVQHRHRPEWGYGLLTWEGSNRRRYHFRDGQTREFKDGWYHLLERVDLPPAERDAIVAELEERAGIAAARRLQRQKARDASSNVLTFDQQVRIFRAQFPEGFEDPKWRDDVRGEGRERPRKADLQPAIDRAQERLSDDSLTKAIATGDIQSAWDDLIEVLRRTSLVTPRTDIEPLERAEGSARSAIVRALRELLYADERPDHQRLVEWKNALAAAVGSLSWQLLTTPAGLVHPDVHVVVHPSSMRTQAKWLAPELNWPSTVSAGAYQKLQALAVNVRQELGKHELVARDLLDVREFVSRTLRPSAKKFLSSS